MTENRSDRFTVFLYCQQWPHILGGRDTSAMLACSVSRGCMPIGVPGAGATKSSSPCRMWADCSSGMPVMLCLCINCMHERILQEPTAR